MIGQSTPENLPDRLMHFHRVSRDNPALAAFAPLVEAAEEIARLREAIEYAHSQGFQWPSDQLPPSEPSNPI